MASRKGAARRRRAQRQRQRRPHAAERNHYNTAALFEPVDYDDEQRDEQLR